MPSRRETHVICFSILSIHNIPQSPHHLQQQHTKTCLMMIIPTPFTVSHSFSSLMSVHHCTDLCMNEEPNRPTDPTTQQAIRSYKHEQMTNIPNLTTQRSSNRRCREIKCVALFFLLTTLWGFVYYFHIHIKLRSNC